METLLEIELLVESLRERSADVRTHDRHRLRPPVDAAQVGLLRRIVERARVQVRQGDAQQGVEQCASTRRVDVLAGQQVDQRRGLAGDRMQEVAARVGCAARAPAGPCAPGAASDRGRRATGRSRGVRTPSAPSRPCRNGRSSWCSGCCLRRLASRSSCRHRARAAARPPYRRRLLYKQPSEKSDVQGDVTRRVQASSRGAGDRGTARRARPASRN